MIATGEKKSIIQGKEMVKYKEGEKVERRIRGKHM